MRARTIKTKVILYFNILSVIAWMEKSQCKTLGLECVTITPPVQSRRMCYRKNTDFSLGTRTQLFIQNVFDSTNPARVLRVNAGEITSLTFEFTSKGIRIKAKFKDVNVFVATHNNNAQKELQQRRKELVAFENSFGFDPAHNSDDLKRFKAILEN